MPPHFRSEKPTGHVADTPARVFADGARPSHLIDVDSDHVQALLEQLDDAVFTALSGCLESLEESRRLWPKVLASLGWDLVDESREQYLRFAVETTEQLQREELRSPERSLAALEVISLLAR